MRRRHLLGMAVACCLAMVLASCSTVVPGKPASVFSDPFRVAGLPASDGPTGLRPDAPSPSRDVKHGDGGEIDKLAASSVSDIEDFWRSAYGDAFGGEFLPVSELVSWDSYGFNREFCGENTFGLVNAGFCPVDGTLGWDRGVLLPQLRKANGDMAVTTVLAHEYGHAIQAQAKLLRRGKNTLVSEQQADCLAGVYLRWVAEDNSPRFTVSTGDGLNKVLAAMISFRDPLFTEADVDDITDEHGSAFERVSAFQFGFTSGASSCAAIDLKEIEQRRGDLPVLLRQDQTGELPVTEQSVRAMMEVLGALFRTARPPKLSLAAESAGKCPDAQPSSPASFCPATNTIVVDLPKLQALGTQSDDSAMAVGDNTAYSVLASRYMLALQRQRPAPPPGLTLDNAEAALRTACLTGVATVKMTKPVATSSGTTIALTAGDVDEAVSGILTNGLVASDVNGESVPSGFSRIAAFRAGVLGDTELCFKRFV